MKEMIKNTLHASMWYTELALLESICAKTEANDCLIFNCHEFPEYHDGNILIANNSNETISRLEQIYQGNVFSKPDLPVNITTPFISEKMEEEALNLKYTPERYTFMSISTAFNSSRNVDFELVEIPQNSIEVLRDFVKKSHPDIPWFYNEGFEKKKQLTKKLSIKWFAIRRHEKSEILASVGVFEQGGIARLQDVQTLPEYQRHGFASLLIGHISCLFLSKHTVKALCLLVSNQNTACQFYKKLGFEKQFEIMNIKKFGNGTESI